jgi:hypothetical protein
MAGQSGQRARSPLLLTGPPAVGKSAAARLLAARRQRCAVLEVDDLRQLVTSGAVAPWVPGEGEAQHLLAARNACSLAESFLAAGFDVVLTDVVPPAPAEVYRGAPHPPLVVRLDASLLETRRRAGTRPVHLTREEFEEVHAAAQGWPAADAVINADPLSLEELVEAVDDLWRRTESAPIQRLSSDGLPR